MKHRTVVINTLTSFSFASTRSGWCRRLCASPPSARRTTTSTAWTPPASRARSRRATSSLPGSSRPRADRERRRRPTTSARARGASARRGGSRNRQSPPDPPTRSLPTQSSRRARRDVRAPPSNVPPFWGRATGPRTGRTARAGDGRGEPKAAETRRRRLSKTERLSQTDCPYARRRTRRGAATRPAGRAGRGRDAAPRPAARVRRAARPASRSAAAATRRGARRVAGRRVYNRVERTVGVFVFVFFSSVSGGEDRAAGGDGRGRSRDGTRAVTLIVGVREDGGIGEGGIARRRRRGR